MRDKAFLKFWRALLHAEDQLRWGTNPVAIADAAAALKAFDPNSRLAPQLEAKAARLRQQTVALHQAGLRSLKSEGLVTLADRLVTLHDIPRLRHIAQINDTRPKSQTLL